MSIRSLFELNHDYVGRIEDFPDHFVRSLLRYLRSGSDDDAHALHDFGLVRDGMRHHSESYPKEPSR